MPIVVRKRSDDLRAVSIVTCIFFSWNGERNLSLVWGHLLFIRCSKAKLKAAQLASSIWYHLPAKQPTVTEHTPNLDPIDLSTLFA